jgi:hypothetical protein
MTVIAFPHPDRAAEAREAPLDELAIEAYSFGFPILMMDMAREAMTQTDRAVCRHDRPVLLKQRAPTIISSELVEAQPFTLFSCAWLDLCREPVIVSVPDAAGRYYTAHALDAWSDVCAAFGTRTNAGRARNYAFVGPFWSGRLPEGMVRVQAPTPMVWLQMRIHAGGEAVDRAEAGALQDKLCFSRLSDWGEAQTAAAEVEADPTGVSVLDRVIALGASEFYGRLCSLMVDNPPPVEEPGFMEPLGIERTRSFDFRSLPWRARAALSASVENPRERLMNRTGRLAPLRPVNGWRVVRNTCHFGNDHDRRAHLALCGLRACDMADRIGAIARSDHRGDSLRGDRAYEIVFEHGELPPAKAFWTLSARSPDVRAGLLSALDGVDLVARKDGGATIRIQRSRPEGKVNWLPVEASEFILALDLHWPADKALEGRWRPPNVRRMD